MYFFIIKKYNDSTTKAKYLGFAFYYQFQEKKYRMKVPKKSLDKVMKKVRKLTSRKWSVSNSYKAKKIVEVVRGWINYFRIGLMKQFVEELGQWLRHKIRMIVMKQWKKPKTIYRNLSYLNRKNRNGFSQEDIHKVANSRLGWYRRSGMNVVNFIISKDLLENRIKDGAGLLNPLSYYLAKVGI